MKFYSPLRYPGGKSKLTKQIISLLETNNYKHGTYVEPFAGGAGIALSLLFNNYVDRIHINDLDTSIYSFWKAILEDNKEFIQLIRDTPITIEEWKRQRSIQDNPENASVLELGFSTFYLNFRKKTYTLNYSAGKAAKGKEVMVFSNNLILNYINDDIKIIL